MWSELKLNSCYIRVGLGIGNVAWYEIKCWKNAALNSTVSPLPIVSKLLSLTKCMTKTATDVCMSFSFQMVAVYRISVIYFEALNSTNSWDLLCTLEVTTKKLHCNLQLARVDIIKSQKWVVLDSSTWHLSSSKTPALVFFNSGVPEYSFP